jgi:peroxiredoxin
VQVPEYVKRFSELKAKGVDEVIVYCVNDGAVMTGWGKALGVTDGSGVTLMGDPQSRLTRRVGMVLKHPGPMGVLGNPRCKRFVMLVDDGEIKALEVSEGEDDPAGDNDPSGPVTAKTKVDHVLTLL